ncbi:UNVERIFIED_CONTAM: hypothetical protein RMT77_015724 [Armadillidium vulgare]
MSSTLEEEKEKIDAKIQEIRKQIHLSEGQNRAFYEESEEEKKRNKDTVNELRNSIKELHLTLHEASRGREKAVEEAITLERKKKNGKLDSRSGSAKISNSNQTIKLSEYRLHDHIKRLNYLQHKGNEKEIRLAKLQHTLEAEGEERVKEQEEAISNLKKGFERLENELERVLTQVSQSETVKKRYEGMVNSLKGDAASYRTNMDIMQKKLLQEKGVLRNLWECRKSAEKTRDDIRRILHYEEDNAFESRKERERKLEDLKKRVEEKSVGEMAALANRKLSLRSPTQRLSPISANELNAPNEKINLDIEKFSQLFSKFKITLGVTSVEEVLDRLEDQRETRDHLHNLRDTTVTELYAKRKEKEILQQELHRVKYDATEDSAKLDGAFEEMESKKAALLETKITLQNELEKNLKILAGVRATLERIAEILQSEDICMKEYEAGTNPLAYITSVKDFCIQEAEKIWTSIKEKETQIQEPLLGMTENEGKPLQDNSRVSFPAEKGRKTTGPQTEDNIDSGEEEEALARRFIKRQAQMVVETKSRRRNRPVSTFRN